jgi:hypothetical protein
MGARPLAAMNSLHFGPLTASDDATDEEKATAAHNRSIMAGVVKGIGDYGNAFGVPTIGGEVRFAGCYSRNPLVNAFTLGIMRKEHIFYGRAARCNPVIYVGAKPAAMAFTARRWLRKNSEKRRNRNAPPSRWGIRFSKSSCSKPAWKRCVRAR